MSHLPIDVVQVFYQPGTVKQLVGRLAIVDRKIVFEYDANFVDSGLVLSPYKLPLRLGVQVCADPVFEGLFGVFNDCLPDGWGRLLLDRKLRATGGSPARLTPLDRLCYVGHRGMGALTFEPECLEVQRPLQHDLDSIADEVAAFIDEDDDQFVDDLLAMNGSSAGARPKIMLQQGNAEWIVKFRSAVDPVDVGPIEYAYHLMAADAGLDVPVAQLFSSRRGSGYFGVKRFDRENGKRVHKP